MFCEDTDKKWQALHIKIIKVYKTSGVLITPFLLPASRAVVQIWNSLFGFRENIFDWKYITMLLHKEYYTIVLCYTGYWWQQTSRLLYVQSWRYIRKDQPTIEEENTFFFHFPTCLFTTLKRIRGAGGICQTDSQSQFNKVLRWELIMKQNMGFGSMAVYSLWIYCNLYNYFV